MNTAEASPQGFLDSNKTNNSDTDTDTIIPLDRNFEAIIQSSQEVPTVKSSNSGSATLTLDITDSHLTIEISLIGLDLDGNQTSGNANDDVTGLHIHRAFLGVNGPIVFGLIGGVKNDTDGDLVIDAVAGTVTSEWDAAEGNGTTLTDELANLRAEGLYINVHTNADPGGEIRGQIIQQILIFDDSFETEDN